jgi:glycerophosphoryl diester phosphodiesterase
MDSSSLRSTLHQRKCIWRVAHRGGMPENKLSGFKTAIDEGCNMIECDVRLSYDNIPVVIHDKTINRTTTGSGDVSKMKVYELQYYGVPSLEDLLIYLANQTKVFIAFEIKDIGGKTRTLLNKTVYLLQKYNVVEQSIIISFNKDVILASKVICPHIMTGIIINKVLFNNPCKIAYKLHADTMWINHKLLPKVMTRNVLNIPIFVWTVNDKQHIAGIDKNIAGVVSDNLSLLFAVEDL